jgi:hypothetical protein
MGGIAVALSEDGCALAVKLGRRASCDTWLRGFSAYRSA